MLKEAEASKRPQKQRQTWPWRVLLLAHLSIYLAKGMQHSALLPQTTSSEKSKSNQEPLSCASESTRYVFLNLGLLSSADFGRIGRAAVGRTWKSPWPRNTCWNQKTLCVWEERLLVFRWKAISQHTDRHACFLFGHLQPVSNQRASDWRRFGTNQTSSLRCGYVTYAKLLIVYFASLSTSYVPNLSILHDFH